jgi:hypothetical protein
MKRAWSIGLAALGFAGGVFAVVACSSDDNSTTPAGQGDGRDATATDDGGEASPDSSNPMHPDSASPHVDASTDAGSSCTGFDASGLDDASVAEGFHAVWQVYRCWGCHQKASQKVDDAGGGIVLSGNNDGLGDSGTTFPPNLTSDPVTGVGCWTNDELVQAILKGKDEDGTSLCPSMPKWGQAIKTTDGGVRSGTPMDAGTAQAIVDYLRSLPVVSNAVPDTTCAAPGDGGADAGADAGDGGP